jgi:LPS-assembly protein
LTDTRRTRGSFTPLRRICAAIALVLATAFTTLPAHAQLLPEGFFDQVPSAGGQAQVEADTMAYDSDEDAIIAEGSAILHYQGYTLTGERIVYNRTTGDMSAEGNVGLLDPQGNLYRMDSVRVTGAMRYAFISSMTLQTEDGSLITADDVTYEAEFRSTLQRASYSPCGQCIDAKGRKIGWRVYAGKIIHDKKGKVVYLEQPTIEVLGIPVAWVPWMALPDMSERTNFRMPQYNYSAKLGHKLVVPYFVPVGDSIDLLLTPTLMTRQGFLMGAEWQQRFDYGSINIKAAGLYQMDRSAFAGTVGDTDWRGAAQISGQFTPLEDWKAGFSYTTFTDAAFLPDYELTDSKNSVNEAYVTHLSDDYYADVRIQKFNLLGNVTWVEQEKQTRVIPNIKAASYTDLGEWGQFRGSTRIMGIGRGADSTATYGGVPYVLGYREEKVHAALEGSWQKQWIAPMGVAVTPYLGLRVDYASYDGGSGLLAGPVSLFSATPIAAVDFRWPHVATNGFDSFLLEPIAQLVYRGSSTAIPGITNDNAQSFVFDDTNLFSYDRFTGSDRQETGLRANVGGRYMANFGDGTWLELIGGQSYHLAGVNSLGIADTAQTGNSTGLGTTASYIVLGAKGSPMQGLTLGTKAQLDPTTFRVARAGAGADFSMNKYTLGLDYFYLPANAANGTLMDQHEATVRASAPLPVFDYWYVDGHFSWDLASNQFLEGGGGLTYDDDYFVAGAFANVTGPTHTSPNALSFGVKVRFRGPLGEIGF